MLAILIHTYFALLRPFEHPWLKRVTYINSLAYAFEALLINEFHGRSYPCASFTPPKSFSSRNSFVYFVAGAIAGELNVSGDAWVQLSYQYSYFYIL